MIPSANRNELLKDLPTELESSTSSSLMIQYISVTLKIQIEDKSVDKEKYNKCKDS